MSHVLAKLISQSIQDNISIERFRFEPVSKDCEDLKGYISESLKTSFKIFCVEKGVTMRFALYNLICLWIKKEYKEVCKIQSDNFPNKLKDE